MNPIEALDRAIVIATINHEGQVDKSGLPYILHPITVMTMVETIEEKIVAILHDVVEDTIMTLDDLRADPVEFSDEVIDAVDAISRRDGESTKQYYDRLVANRLAMKVKIADLEHNMSMPRLLTIRDKDLNRVRYYHSKWKHLKSLL